MKHIHFYIIIVTLSYVSSLTCHQLPYNAEDLCANVDTHTAHLILNFCYWSYWRAEATIIWQNQLKENVFHYVRHLERLHHMRHNPEYASQEITIDEAPDITIDNTEYQRICNAYVTCHRRLLNSETSPLPETTRKQLHKVRDHIKGEISAILATRLLRTYDILSNVYTAIQTLYTNFAYFLFKRSFFSTVWQYVPSFLIGMTYRFESRHLDLREHLYSILYEDICISDELWYDIEETRKTLYYALYQEVYDYLIKHGYDNIVFTPMTEISPHRHMYYLPPPCTE